MQVEEEPLQLRQLAVHMSHWEPVQKVPAMQLRQVTDELQVAQGGEQLRQVDPER